MSNRPYVYEDPSIGAIISTLGALDYVLGERAYHSLLTQSLKKRGDLTLYYREAKFIVIEFKAPYHDVCNGVKCWKYKITQAGSTAYRELADKGLLFLGLIHALVNPAKVPPDGGGTYRHAPFTTAFVLPEDTKKCLDSIQQKRVLSVLRAWHPHYYIYPPRLNPLLWFKAPVFKRDFIRWDFYIERLCQIICMGRSCYKCIYKVETIECGEISAFDLASLLYYLQTCQIGSLLGEESELLRRATESLKEGAGEYNLWVLLSTYELFPLLDISEML
ncbi:MAG: hypothetical protein QW680_06785 [Pyrobaculum sp.]